MRELRVRSIAAFSIAVLSVAACDRGSLTPDTGDEPPPGMVLSNTTNTRPVFNAEGPLATISSSTDGTVSYVSIAPGTYPAALDAQIRNRTTGADPISVYVSEGGFDPVAVAAREGDLLEVRIVTRSAAPVRFTLKVPRRRPPAIVRVNPPKGRVDVALNQNMLLVFSEPIQGPSLNVSSVRLLKNGQVVAGSVRFAGNAWTAEFVPDQQLTATTTYELTVTQGVRDLDGDPLEAAYSTTFTTQADPCPGYAIPGNCPPFPTGGEKSISGVTYERTIDGLRPLAGATVFAWVQFAGYGYSRGGVQSDSSGHYRIDKLPNTLIQLQGWAEGYDQPCGMVVTLTGSDTTMNVELVSQSRPLPDLATAPPVVTGVVYEGTGPNHETLVPLPGVRIFFEVFPDLVSAITTTDKDGRYAICRAPSFFFPQYLTAYKEGYPMQAKEINAQEAPRTERDFVLSR